DVREEPRGDILRKDIAIGPGQASDTITLNYSGILSGSNPIRLEWGEGNVQVGKVVNWNIRSPGAIKWETVDLSRFLNDNVTKIFQHRYESPRASSPTVQIPLQGIGNWCYPLVNANIDDSGLRALAGEDGVFETPEGIPFATPGPGLENNIVFTSLWDNFPEEITIPLSGKASHAYLLMAGSTNPMQSRFDNGIVEVEYEDGAKTELPLRNP
ncbi:MAG: hypothetical protein KDD06_29740, partial [Phaeodactylibacter sp.]|nr:hypothetical protein [Phaeodactylibacter sp.]